MITSGDVAVDKLSNGDYKYTFIPSNIVKNGLVLWLNGLDFRNTSNKWKDQSGYGNDATAYNLGYNLTSGSNGNGSVVFDGADDYFSIANNATLNPYKELTLEIKGSVFSNTKSYEANFIDKFGYSNYRIGFTTTGYIHTTVTATNALNGTTYVDDYGGVYYPAKNTTFHATYVYDGTNGLAKLYVNGLLHNQKTIESNMPIKNNNTSILIGKMLNYETINGSLEMARIYNRALTSEEVLQNYNAEK